MTKKNNDENHSLETGFPHLDPFEKETIIVFNKGEKEAAIFTYEKTWQKHLETRFKLTPIMDNGYGGKEYVIDKDRIKMPRVPLAKKKSSARKE